MANLRTSILTLAIISAATGSVAQQPEIFLADPTIFADKGKFYLYGTGSSQGFLFYESSDLKTWNQPGDSSRRLALKRGDAFGTSGFWAPQVVKHGNSYYMAYTANEQIAIAKADSPAGPFRQNTPLALSGSGKQIDPFLFFDENGKTYLYHVKLQNGNRIFVTEMKPDLSDVIPGTEKECIASTDGWENTANASWPVAEGPTVLKHKNIYYLIYSSNDFRNKDYAVGYATSSSPTGPWKKYTGNPVISRHTVGQNGSGHGDVFFDKSGKMFYVMHTHRSRDRVSPRATAVVSLKFRAANGGEDVLEADPKSFRWLETEQPATANTYQNPLPVEFGDPYVLHVKGDKYYMYGTGGAKNGFAAYSSADLVNWKNEGQVYHANNKNGWSDSTAAWGGAYWAPEVYDYKGKFYMFYSAQWKDNPGKDLENFRVGVAVSDNPAGPFTDISNKPVFDPGYPIIDANVLFDENGRIYLYYSRCCYKHPVESEVAAWAKQKGWFDTIEESWVYGVELKPDFSGVIGEPVMLLRPPVKMNDKQADWESRSVTSKEVNRRWTEGSVAFKKGDTYYMMYSANYFGGKNYAVGYATSKSPLGPFTKASNNPVLQKNVEKGGVVTGTGHNSITYSPDGKEMLCVYHARTSATGDKRVVFIDRMKILKDGKLVVEGPTTAPQAVPGNR